jgi:hypothetical protein
MGRFSTRLPALLSLWASAAVAEAILYYFLVSQPYFRAFFATFAVALLVAAAVATWRVVRPRGVADRRTHERRSAHRRANK